MFILVKGGWCFLDDKGFSWPETMLSLAMLFMLFGTLLPMMQHLQQSLHAKKERLIAFETLHEAAIEIKGYGSESGERLAGGTYYRWEKTEQLCVFYNDFRNTPKQECLK